MTSTAPTSKTVLIADDTAFVRDRFKGALEGAGHRAVTVKSATDLLARVRADLATLDLLVMDLHLPHATGLDVMRSIREMDNGGLPILVFSRSGIAIRTTSPLDKGATVRLRFPLPGSNRDIDAEAVVCWSDQRTGMGLQYEKAEGIEQTSIDDFVDAHFFQPRK